MNPTKHKSPCCCSFCGKPSSEVAKLIAGPGIYICDECVIICGELLAKELPGWPKFLRCPNDPLRVTHDMLTAMRDAGEIPETVFSARLVEAVVREFAPAPKSPPKTKRSGPNSKGSA